MTRRSSKGQPPDLEHEPEPLLWGFDALVRHVRHEDPEVRAWAAGRLMQHFPGRGAEALASLVLDDAANAGEHVAEHLARHGGARQVAILERGVRHGRGKVPAACLTALARLGHASVEALAASAVSRQDLGDEGDAALLAALLRHGEPDPAREVALAQMRAHPAVMIDPGACRELFARFDPSDYPFLIRKLVEALGWRGADRAQGAFQGMLDGLEVEDAGWLLHTDRGHRILVDRTLKAYDATYDVEVRAALGDDWLRRFRVAFEDGSLSAVGRALREFCDERAAGAGGEADAERERVRAAAAALADPTILSDLEALGPGASSPAVVTLLSCALRLAAFRSLRQELAAADGNLDRLLPLLEVESAALLDRLPDAVERAVRDDADRARVIRFAADVLGRRGPWYGRLLALDVLGRLRAAEEAHDVIHCLDDDSDAILEAAGRALERMGPDAVGSIRAALEGGHVHPDGMEWMVAAACQAGTREALALITDHWDELIAELDPGFVCEWASVLGLEEMIPRFRRLLDQDVAAVGRSLLLVSAIHNRRVPEEDRILRALDQADHGEEPGPGEGRDGGETPGGGSYVM